MALFAAPLRSPLATFFTASTVLLAAEAAFLKLPVPGALFTIACPTTFPTFP